MGPVGTRQMGDESPEGTRARRARVFRQDMDVLSKNPAPSCVPGGQEPGRRVHWVAFSLPGGVKIEVHHRFVAQARGAQVFVEILLLASETPS